MDYREAVRWLYAHHGRWKAVADACAVNGDRPTRNAYRKLEKGETRRPSRRLQKCIRHGVTGLPESHQRHVTGGYTQNERLGLSLPRPLGNRLNAWRKRHGMTWAEWAAEADELMRLEYEEVNG